MVKKGAFREDSLTVNTDVALNPTFLPPDSSWNQVGENAPPFFRLVLYRTPYYQMMGYMNRLGRWIASDGKPENMPVRWWREIGGSHSSSVEHFGPAILT